MKRSIFPGVFQRDSHIRRTGPRLPALALTGPVLALTGMACISPAFAAAPCPAPFAKMADQAVIQPAAGQAGFSSSYRKSEAILQGAVSRLDSIRMQQAERPGSAFPAQPTSGAIVRPQAFASLSSLFASPFSLSLAVDAPPVERSAPSFFKSKYTADSLPALSPALFKPLIVPAPQAADCLNAAAPSFAYERNPGPSSAERVRPGQPDVFGSVALSVSRTALDGKWRAASGATLAGHAGPWAAVIAQNRNLPRAAQIRAINAWVNARIAYVEDVRQYGAADLWSPAAQSLTRGRGDCEDYAIAKMQLLRALGVPADSMFLVIARDLVRRADHAILAVAVDGDLVVLDNETDRILSSAEIRDYRPILSFNARGSWTHGYRTAPPAAALRYASLAR